MAAQPEADVTAALRAGDETVFAGLVRTWSPALVRTAMALTGDRAAADQVLRRTWLRLPAELEGYRPPPELLGWFAVCCWVSSARVSGPTSRHTAPSCLARPSTRLGFPPPTHPVWPGHWQVPPAVWPAMGDARSSSHGVGTALRAALDGLPPAHRVIVGLRDIAGCEVARYHRD